MFYVISNIFEGVASKIKSEFYYFFSKKCKMMRFDTFEKSDIFRAYHINELEKNIELARIYEKV